MNYPSLYFTDLRRARLLALECEEPQRDCNGRNGTHIGLNRNLGCFPVRIIKSSIDSSINPEHIPMESKSVFGQDIGEVHVISKVDKRIWILNSVPEKKIQINCYQHDGALALHCINRISIFYYKGDSVGDSGSGQWWLGPTLFNMILDKLVDGGLIVTDGSNPDPDYLDALWRPLWKNNCNGRPAQMPEDFEYCHRTFTCLGQCGERYGPVYAWQVNRSR